MNLTEWADRERYDLGAIIETLRSSHDPKAVMAASEDLNSMAMDFHDDLSDQPEPDFSNVTVETMRTPKTYEVPDDDDHLMPSVN
jgi:hypothetical protein